MFPVLCGSRGVVSVAGVTVTVWGSSAIKLTWLDVPVLCGSLVVSPAGVTVTAWDSSTIESTWLVVPVICRSLVVSKAVVTVTD
jgi:hypothetical protein